MGSRLVRGGVAGFGLLLALPALAGCLGTGSGDREAPPGGAAFPRGVHPWPSGDEWPTGLTGPFGLREILHEPVTSFDGTRLDGWVLLPDVPEGVKVPVVLWSAPYFGQCSYLQAGPPVCNYAVGTDPALRDTDRVSESVPVAFLLAHGYAVAVYNVRGTGNSGGCFEWFGPNEQRDQAVLVEWLGTQPSSNGRVAMQGLSYHGTTPWEAAIQETPHLATIVVAGMVSDAYTFSHSPQGATFASIGLFESHFAWRVSLSPPIAGGAQHATADHAPVVPERACPDLAKAIADDSLGVAADRRDEAFWDARRLIDRFPDVTAAVFLTHGFQDLWGSGHQQQENAAWGALTKAPKRMLEGQWGHEMPQWNSVHPDWALGDTWNETLLAWYEFWLKGIGENAPGLGTVTYADSTGRWLNSTSWPPAESRPEVLHLAGGALSAGAATADATFHSLLQDFGPLAAFCDGATTLENPLTPPPAIAFFSDPVANDTLVAGNPFAYLTVSSNLPGGELAVHLYDVAPDASCPGGNPDGYRRLAVGVADLRFHAGNFVGKDFPLDAPTPVRIDITNLAEVLAAGHRLAAVLSYGEPLDRVPALGLQPVLTLRPGSHLVVPFVEGTLGGGAPTLEYPPRPFVPVVEE